MTARFSIVTTCKGRLHNLKRTLPRFLAQENAEVIVVDYDCPDGTAEYVAANHPRARLVRVADQPLFNLGHARNLGAAQAVGEYLVFLDADVVIADTFLTELDGALGTAAFAVFAPTAGNSLRGSCVIRRREFLAIGGYDELMRGYGGEDLDIYMRLRMIGAPRAMLDPGAVVEMIEQDDAEKARFRGPDLKKQFLQGQLYVAVKEMVMSVERLAVLEPALRQQIYDEVRRNLDPLYAGVGDFALEVRLPDKYKRGFLQEWEFSRAVVVRARRRKPAADGGDASPT